ncbi:MAG: hypothetical protein QM597_05585, partial [Aeromicrobium sp.]|uniref:hypothetical protein n=1 Tax=Aeromicrobium sp. TaxID=1871063 RepID=UPI0039E384A5
MAVVIVALAALVEAQAERAAAVAAAALVARAGSRGAVRVKAARGVLVARAVPVELVAQGAKVVMPAT